MAQYGDKYEDAQNQEFGTQLVNEKANITGRGISTEATPTTGPTVVGHPQHEKLHRTGSLSSSSSEDEEGDMRKKKGLPEKIVEKIHGVGPKGQQSHDGTTTTTVATTVPGGIGEHGEEKKGIMEKIKEKLPGHN